MSGSEPRRVVDPAASADVPPLVLRDDARPKSAVSRGAKLLATGDWRAAGATFEQRAQTHPDDTMAAAGLAMSRWRIAGSATVIQELQSIAGQHPRDQWIRLQIGVSQMVAGQDEEAQATLAGVFRAASVDPASLDVARRADDLLHPTLAPGYPPLLVRAQDVGDPGSSRLVARLVEAVRRGDRRAAARLGRGASRDALARDPLAAIAVAVASFDKDRALRTVSELDRIDARLDAQQHVTRSALLVHRALVLVWSGDPTAARQTLDRAITESTSPGAGRWHRQAVALDHVIRPTA